MMEFACGIIVGAGWMFAAFCIVGALEQWWFSKTRGER